MRPVIKYICYVIIPIIVICTIYVFSIYLFVKPKLDKYNKEHDIKVIDSLINANNKLILETEYIDSIKNEEIIRVKSFDNDSTIKLFYQLIRE